MEARKDFISISERISKKAVSVSNIIKASMQDIDDEEYESVTQ